MLLTRRQRRLPAKQASLFRPRIIDFALLSSLSERINILSSRTRTVRRNVVIGCRPDAMNVTVKLLYT